MDVNPNEFNKSSPQNMFNTMLVHVTGLFPEPWTKSITIPVFEKG